MTKSDARQLMARAGEDVERPAERAALVGEAVRKNAKAMLYSDTLVAFIRWQALQFGNTWDEVALSDALSFLRYVTIIWID